MPPKKKSKIEEEKKMEEDKKRKAEETKDVAPKKLPRKDEEAGPKKEAKKDDKGKKEEAEEHEGVEKEKDQPADKRPAFSATVEFNPADTTMNVVPSCGGRVLMALSEGGLQYLIAGARANVGLKTGRHMYEVRIIEALNPAEASGGARGRVPIPRQLVRLGFSTADAPLILNESNKDSVCFDSEGFYIADEKKSSAAQKLTRDQVISVMLNLDLQSPNANTVSLFRDGERIADPQPIPEHLHGKTLFPHICFRSVTVQVMFGSTPAKPLSFKCKMVQGAAKEDVEHHPMPTNNGKFDVMLPVAFPDEGTFDWLDMFLKKHPGYVELSDRKILEWAGSSGLWKPKAGGWKASNDKPEFNFGLPSMDDLSIRRVLRNIAPLVPRNYVIMEVKSNLIAEERKEVLQRFSGPSFRKVARVVMGEPNEEYKKAQLDKLLAEKQEKAHGEWKAKQAEKERKKQAQLRQKQLQEMRKKADETRKKVAEEAKRKLDEAKHKAEEAKKKAEEEKKTKEEAVETPAKTEVKDDTEAKVEDAGAAANEVKEEEKDAPKAEAEAKVEAKEEEEEKEEKKEEPAEEDKMEEDDEGPPQVELTDEEKLMWFPKAPGTSDLTTVVLSQSFANFTVPEQEEGFDVVEYEWQDAKTSKEYLRKWVLEKKVTSRIDDLQPGEWFKERLTAFQKGYAEWQQKQKAFKATESKKPKEEKAEERADGEEKEECPEKGNDVDIYAVEDVTDVGNGEPLFKDFTFEDWVLLQLRLELHLLQVAFKRDVNDTERPGIHETHLAFYYNKYYRKQLNPKYFGLTTNMEICQLVKDTVIIDPDSQVLVSRLEGECESLDSYVKQTEENRRERQRRIDAGDETAKLKFSPLAMQQATPAAKSSAPAGAAAGSVAAARPAAGQTWPTGGGRPNFPAPRPPSQPAWSPGGRWPGQQQTTYAPRQNFQQKWR